MSGTTVSFPYLSAILVICLIGLLVILFLPPKRIMWIKGVSAVFSGATLILAMYLFVAYDQTQGGLQFVEKFVWEPSLGISYHHAADGFNLPMLLLTGIVFFTGVLTMWELEYRVKEFFALTFLLVIGVFGLFMSLDLFFIFVWYDVSLFPMYLLIAVWGSTRKEYGAMKLTLYLLAGSALILPAILYLFVQSGLNTFDVIRLAQAGIFTPSQQKFAFLLLYVGFGILAGVWPFHTWSPVGHVAAPTTVSMIHAGVLMKIGAFGILRVAMFLCPIGWQFWAETMAVLGAIGIVYGALVGLGQTDLKYIIGYSSVSHMGIVGLGLSTVTVDGLNGAVFQMFAHGIMTALLFSAVGYIYDRTHTRTLDELGGLCHQMPVASGYFILAALAGMGIPFMASFWGELMVFLSAVKVYPVLGGLAVSALVISALFMLRVVQKAFYGPANEKFVELVDIPWRRGIPRLILAAVIVFFGIFPALMFDMISSAAVPFIDRVGGAMNGWTACMPEIGSFGGILIFMGWSLYRRKSPRRMYATALSLSALIVMLCLAGVNAEALLFTGTYRVDLFSQVFKVLLAIGLFLTICTCSDLDGISFRRHAEFYLLLFASNLGTMLLVSSTHLLIIFVSLELSSYSLYLLTALRRNQSLGIEASLKYFLVGAISSAVMLFGIALLYGNLQVTTVADLAQFLPNTIDDPLVIFGLLLALGGFFFKLAIFPFHFWIPDVYQGAANQVAAYIATASKVAAIAILIRIVACVDASGSALANILAALAVVSMTVGNLSAIVQKDFKRVLAYSSVAHAGYVMIGIVSMNETGYAAAVYYALAVVLLNFACFMVLISVAQDGGNLRISQLAGLHYRSPLLALVLLLALFGLAGIPPTVGFTGKLLVFTAAMQNGYFALVLVAMLNVVVSLYYYLQVVKAAYLLEPTEPLEDVEMSLPLKVLAGLLAFSIVAAGIYPAYFLRLFRAAVLGLT